MLIPTDYPFRFSVRPSFRNNLFLCVLLALCFLCYDVMGYDRPYHTDFPWLACMIGRKLTFSVVSTHINATQLSTLNKTINCFNLETYLQQWLRMNLSLHLKSGTFSAESCSLCNLGNRNSTRFRDTISTTSPRTCTHINGGFTTDRMNGLCSFARPSFTSSGCWRKFAYARITVC